MPKTKRFEETVELTIRMPKSLRDRAREVVRQLEDNRVLVKCPGVIYSGPGFGVGVKPSIAVLAIRGLAAQVDELEKELRDR